MAVAAGDVCVAMNITVKYTCGLCDLEDIEVDLPERLADESVMDFMDRLIIALSDDHSRRRPKCHPRELKHVKIPMPEGNDPIGTVTKH